MIQAQQNHDTAIWISADHYVMTCMAEVASRPNSDEGALSSCESGVAPANSC